MHWLVEVREDPSIRAAESINIAQLQQDLISQEVADHRYADRMLNPQIRGKSAAPGVDSSGVSLAQYRKSSFSFEFAFQRIQAGLRRSN
jgi:hypothetical protein